MGKNLLNKNWFTIKKLTQNIWGIGEFKHFEKVISYLIIGEKETLLIDTGLGINNIKKTIDSITKKPIAVINTHGHFDHIGGNKLFNLILNQSTTRTINLKPFHFKILKTPGHSPDSICLYEINNHWLFSGDTLYPGPIYLHLKESSIKNYINSLGKLLKLKISHIFPAHNDFNFPIDNIKKIYQNVLNSELKNEILIDKNTSLLINRN